MVRIEQLPNGWKSWGKDRTDVAETLVEGQNAVEALDNLVMAFNNGDLPDGSDFYLEIVD